MQTITLRSEPAIARIVRAAFSAYKKHNCFLSVFSQEHGKTINSYWDGGSRDIYVIVDLSTMTVRSLPTSTHPYFDIERHGGANQENPDVVTDDKGIITLKHLPEGFALVQGGTFCGKTATVHVYLNSANMNKLIGPLA